MIIYPPRVVTRENRSQVVFHTPSALPNEAVAALAGVRAQRRTHAVAGIHEVPTLGNPGWCLVIKSIMMSIITKIITSCEVVIINKLLIHIFVNMMLSDIYIYIYINVWWCLIVDVFNMMVLTWCYLHYVINNHSLNTSQ